MGEVYYLARHAGPRPAPNRGQTQLPHRRRILLAYSGKAKREYLAVFLASRGYDVTACADGKEALAYLAGSHFDLLVTGIVMPRMDGLGVLAALRHRSHPPIIAV